MMRTKIIKRIINWMPPAVFFGVALGLTLHTNSSKVYDKYQLIWDQQWLNAWILFSCAVLALLWRMEAEAPLKRWLMLTCMGVFGFVVVSLIFNGTPFGWNAYWGDQKFRQAMILKFMVFASPIDFYYKDLPPFYPPLYFYLLSLYGKLFNVEYFKLLKIGSLYLYLFSPILLYFLWSRIVSRWQAVVIGMTTLVFCATYFSMPLTIPHEYLANIMFVPWYLGWVQGLIRKRSGWWFYMSGGLIGGIIFMIYYYAFFIGGLLLMANLGVWFYCSKDKDTDLVRGFKPGQALAVMGLAALVSAPYWGPLLKSMLTIGADSVQQEWFHVSYIGLHFRFLELSWAGTLFLAAMVYSVRRRTALVHRGLLSLVAASVGFYVVGYILGNIGYPILYKKADDFLYIVGGAMIGLMVIGLLRNERRGGMTRGAVGLVSIILLVVFWNDLSRTIHSKTVATARSARVKTWKMDNQSAEERVGSVFLMAHETLPSFYPVFAFNANNQQYSHPASRYLDRHRLLYLLQEVNDPYLFYLALRYNQYDQVDYFMPREIDGRFELWSNLSRYPDRFVANTMSYSPELVADTSFFVPETGEHLFRLVDRADQPLPNPAAGDKDVGDKKTMVDQLALSYCMRLIEDQLTEEGRSLWRRYLGDDSLTYVQLERMPGIDAFGDEISMPYPALVAETSDSLYLLTCFEASQEIKTSYRIFLHLYQSKLPADQANFDFDPKRPTNWWKQGDLVISVRAFPRGKYASFHLGFFTGDNREGPGWKCDLPSD